MRGVFLFILSIVLCSGCARSVRESDCDVCKPTLAVLPVVQNEPVKELPWSVRREFTDEIRKKIFESTKVDLIRKGGNEALAKKLSDPHLYKGEKEMKEVLHPADFVVVCELIDHSQTPYEMAATKKNRYQPDIGAVLSLAMRVRVWDMREDSPKVVLQEIVTQKKDIAKAYLYSDYKKNAWGSQGYLRTPIGLMHHRLVQEIVGHVEGQIEALR